MLMRRLWNLRPVVVAMVWAIVLNAWPVWVHAAAFDQSLPEVDLQPSPEEVVCLEYINRFRADPAADIERILFGLEQGIVGMKDGIDEAMCREEVKALAPRPPLVFNVDLMQSARGHARYLIANAVTQHHQTPGKPAFTGASVGDRVRSTAYGGISMGENAFGEALGPWHSHRGYIIDWGEGPGNMQPGRGHRRALHGAWAREIGIGAVPYRNGQNQHLAVVHNFGNHPQVQRYVGGVIYDDANGNHFYDVGEGLAGAEIVADTGEAVRAWEAGAYTLALGHQQAVGIAVRLPDGRQHRWQIPAGASTAKRDWRVPDAENAARVAALMAEAEAIDEASPVAAQASLWVRAQAVVLDPAATAVIAERCAAGITALRDDQERLRTALLERDAGAVRRLLRTAKRRYRDPEVQRWFEDGALAAELFDHACTVEHTARRRRPVTQRWVHEVEDCLRRARGEIETAEFVDLMRQSAQIIDYLLGGR